jgi:hypothetical protein
MKLLKDSRDTPVLLPLSSDSSNLIVNEATWFVKSMFFCVVVLASEDSGAIDAFRFLPNGRCQNESCKVGVVLGDPEMESRRGTSSKTAKELFRPAVRSVPEGGADGGDVSSSDDTSGREYPPKSSHIEEDCIPKSKDATKELRKVNHESITE